MLYVTCVLGVYTYIRMQHYMLYVLHICCIRSHHVSHTRRYVSSHLGGQSFVLLYLTRCGVKSSEVEGN